MATTTPNVSEVTPAALLQDIIKEHPSIPDDTKVDNEENKVEEKVEDITASAKVISPAELVTGKQKNKEQQAVILKPAAVVGVDPVVSPTSMLKATTPGAATVKERIEKYLTYSDSIGQKKAVEIIELFQDIIQAAIHAQDDRTALDEVFTFFKKNRKKLLHPDTALKGIQYLQHARREKLQIAYMLLWEVSSPTTTVPISFEKASRVLGSQGLVSYLQEKVKS